MVNLAFYERLNKIKRIVRKKDSEISLREAMILWLFKTGRDLDVIEGAAIALKPEHFVAMAKEEWW